MRTLEDPVLVGLLVQSCGAFALAAVYGLLQARLRRAALRLWAASWAALGFALLALLFALVLPSFAYAGQVAYLFLEYAYGVLLVAGCLSHTRGRGFDRQAWLWLVPAALLALALPIWTHGELVVMFIPQSMILAAFCATAGVILLGTRPRGVGRNLACTALALLALDFLQYAPIFWRAAAFGAPLPEAYLRFTSLLLLLLESLLGMAGLLLVAERRDRELQRQNRELAEARARLASLARVDPLTAAFNRHAFDELMQAGAGALGPGSVAMLDIDQLKAVNDAYGHAAGDAVIVHSAEAIRRRLRAEDAVFRWGGDEFLVVAFGMSDGELARRLEDFGQKVEHVEVPGAPERLQVGASVGCAAFAAVADLDEAIRLADAAMYRHKAAAGTTGGARPWRLHGSVPAHS